MKTSPEGRAALELEEGVVLRAYRCPAGKWTVGAGITSAAGVGKVGPGMVITAQRASDMLSAALSKSYEPAVAVAMPGAAQHEFDAGVLFHWNTGAIKRASWVPLWVMKATRPVIEAKIKLWTKGGGKVLPGLVKRRSRECLILFEGKYPARAEPRSKSVALARWALPLDLPEKVAALGALARLGYAVGLDPAAVPAAEVRRFQADHALTADGVIGRATLSTVQRRVDAVAKSKPLAFAAVGSGSTVALPSGTSDATDWIAAQSWALPALIGAVALWGLYLGWRYRDVIAVGLAKRAPRLAAFLRSI